MPLYDYRCEKCGKKIECIAPAEAMRRHCPGNALKDHPDLLEKCKGIMIKLPGIFNVHDAWKWMVVTTDGLGVIKDPGDPVDTLYDSMDEQEFYEGPGGEYAYPHESIAPMRYHDGVPWWQRDEWDADREEQEGNADDSTEEE